MVPIAFNVAFFELSRVFDYLDFLHKEPDEILRRVVAGGSGLILRWEALPISALAMLRWPRWWRSSSAHRRR